MEAMGHDLSTENVVKQLPGYEWCSPDKRAATLKLIAEHAPQLIVEIGSFGGGWLLPAAIAAPRAFWCVGIDPYDAGACVEGMSNAENLAYWNNREMLEGVYKHLLRAIATLDLKNVVIHRARSEDRAVHFVGGCIDLLHIDGNHSAEPALKDAMLYLPKVRVGGHIICDDIGWHESGVETVRPMVNWLLANGCEWLFEAGGAGFLRKVR